MRWRELVASVHVQSAGGEGNPTVHDITYDSRRVGPGTVFVAVPGMTVQGDSFIADAIAQGAVAIVSAHCQPQCPLPWIQVADPRVALGEMARALWNVDIQRMSTVGVTGTNGKTTIAHLCRRLLTAIHGTEDAVWMFTTVGYYAGDRFLPATHTTPASCDVFRLIGNTAERPLALVMEVSSHALALQRVAGLSFDCAVWTNLTQDHLDFHRTMEEYYQAKKKLFTHFMKSTGRAVINVDDAWGARLVQELNRCDVVTYGAHNEAHVKIVDWRCDWEGTEVNIMVGRRTVRLKSRLIGLFNVYNMAALCGAAVALSIDLERVRAVLTDFQPVAGRLEKVPIDAGFVVVVDYAHTPDALDKVLATVRQLTHRGRLLCVFGCGGNRDRAKRPRMAQAAIRHCDEIVITSDNPRMENPRAIIDEILEGVPLDYPHWIIPDRREAIGKALSIARSGDCIVIAGKGHETYQEIAGIRYPFSDREIVVEEWQRLLQQYASKGGVAVAGGKK